MILVNVPMPERCYECPFADGIYCNAMDDKPIPKMVWIKRRPYWCPIKGEVVTCGECKFADKQPDHGYYCRQLDIYTDGNWYCAGAQRKE